MTNLESLIRTYFDVQSVIYDYFGYVENWRVIPLDDSTDFFWTIASDSVHFAKTEEELKAQSGNYYVDYIYTQRFLAKWVYRGPEYTMVCSDTQTDGNKFLRIFDNSKERPFTEE